MNWLLLALLALPGPRAEALTPASCAAGGGCLCGEWTGMIWAWRKFGGAKCCDPNFTFHGKSASQYEAHLRGPVAAFMGAMEERYGSKDSNACDDAAGGAPELAPLLSAAWGGFEFEGISCVCDPMTRDVCKGFISEIGNPSAGQGRGAKCGWEGKDAGAPAGLGAAAGKAGKAGPKAMDKTVDKAIDQVVEKRPDLVDPKNPTKVNNPEEFNREVVAEITYMTGMSPQRAQAAWQGYVARHGTGRTATKTTRPGKSRK